MSTVKREEKNKLRLHGIQKGKWRSSLHLPKWACRTWLEITEIRVESLGQITEADARSEGVASVAEFIELWRSINKTWQPELWVWVIGFRMVEG